MNLHPKNICPLNWASQLKLQPFRPRTSLMGSWIKSEKESTDPNPKVSASSLLTISTCPRKRNMEPNHPSNWSDNFWIKEDGTNIKIRINLSRKLSTPFCWLPWDHQEEEDPSSPPEFWGISRSPPSPPSKMKPSTVFSQQFWNGSSALSVSTRISWKPNQKYSIQPCKSTKTQ